MSGKFLLDTNIVIGLFNNDESILGSLSQAEEVFIPSIVLGELYFGANKSSKVETNIARLQQFMVNSAILSCDGDTAPYYGLIKFALRQRGRPIPENDIWIAAMAQQHALTVVSRDNHFQYVNNLETEMW